jgi:hypothetical protein
MVIKNLKVFYAICFMLSAFTVKAQYEKGDILVNPGVSFLGYNFGYSAAYGTYSIGLPALSASVEYNVTEDIGVGVYGGFQTRSYKYLGFKDRLTNIGFGVRGVYHGSKLLEIDAEKFDVYGGGALGFNVFTWSSKDRDDNYFDGRSSGALSLGIIVGGRYMFKPNVGVFAEVGRGSFGIVTVGATLKL